MCCYFLFSSEEGSKHAGCAWEALHTLMSLLNLAGYWGSATNWHPQHKPGELLNQSGGPRMLRKAFCSNKPHYLTCPFSQLLMLRTELVMTFHVHISFSYSLLYYIFDHIWVELVAYQTACVCVNANTRVLCSVPHSERGDNSIWRHW